MAPSRPPHRGRPRPVAGLPDLDPVAVARAWLIELLAHTPLEEVHAVPVALLALEAPALCGAIAEAVAADEPLERLASGDRTLLATRAGLLAGAVAPADVVTAVDTLRVVLHRALRTEGDADVAADAGDRLAHVCARVAALAVAAAPDEDPPAAQDVPVTAPAPAAPIRGEAPPRRPAPAVPAAPPAPVGEPEGAPERAPEVIPRHVTALERALATATGTVTVLALELDGRERLIAVDGEEALAAALVPLEEALTAAAGPENRVVGEGTGRWWVVAPERGTDAGRALAETLVGVLAETAPLRHGERLTASIGVAVHPDDGRDAAALLAHADEGVFTARALGVPVA